MVLSPAWFWTLAVDRDHHDPASGRLHSGPVSEGRRRGAEAAPRLRRALGRPPLLPGVVHPRVPPVRGALQSRRDCSHGLAADHPPAASRVEPVRRRRSPAAARTSPPPSGRCGSPLSISLRRWSIWRSRGRPRWRSAGPVLGLWMASPAIAWWISRPLARRGANLTADQTVFLRKLARKTWVFFETFVGPEDHWLPPDNFQELAEAEDRASHVADQHGARSALEPVRLRLRLHPRRAAHRAHGERVRHDGSPGTPPGPLLQLVRHADPGPAAASLRLHRGQRQPGGPPADLARRVCSRFPITRSWDRDCSRA